MINKTTITVSAELADLMTSLVENTLQQTDKDDLYETVFNFWRDTMKRYDSETVNTIAANLKNVVW